jgi:2,4-dienoyl-CoA reductase-like NADH-dependent reductase (Old Yellow Enzyme family)
LALVNGFRTRAMMESVLGLSLAQLISLSRPFIAEPGLANRLAGSPDVQVHCVRCNRCFPEHLGDGIKCRNERVQEKVNAPTTAG